jgi:hypothetical protein
MESWYGADISVLSLQHFRGQCQSVKTKRADAAVALALPEEVTGEELEYLWQNVDELIRQKGTVVGRLAEWGSKAKY